MFIAKWVLSGKKSSQDGKNGVYQHAHDACFGVGPPLSKLVPSDFARQFRTKMCFVIQGRLYSLLYSWACAGFVTAGCWIKIVCVQLEWSERSEQSVLTAWGPGARSRAPGGVQGQCGGPGGRAPGSSWVFRVFKTPKCLSPRIGFLSF